MKIRAFINFTDITNPTDPRIDDLIALVCKEFEALGNRVGSDDLYLDECTVMTEDYMLHKIF